MTREMKWKTLSSKYVYHDRWFKARAASCELPDGRIIEPYYVVELPNWANVVVVTKDERMVFVRQYRYAGDMITIELPGGVIDKNESPEAAVKREMIEETGYTSNEIEVLYQVSPNPAINDNTAYFYLARNAEPGGTQKFDPFEDIEVVSFSKEEVIQLLREGKFQHGVQVGAIYDALVKLKWL